ncbi:hypothetical protein BDV96DRAFT_360550 [Lophiotrema nucula]|uniref:NADAR domain-containing protein n=1 Tax=Lophiotrema nucula TaxID=690887 RepID=A0A6A5ZHU2_9PLEO|nr:hypothetical protein BDV96DRAFT_360550 [Lophiotrema nucula]
MPKAKRKAVAKAKISTQPSTNRRTRSSVRAESKVKIKEEAQESAPQPSPARVKANRRINVKAETSTIPPKQPPLFFWKETEREGGFLSPWYRSTFQSNGRTYQSAGQCIIAAKARTFGDKGTLKRILATADAEELKALGDSVKDFNENQWQSHGANFANDANMAKFTRGKQSKSLLQRLNDLGTRELVFADPSDSFLGIGYEAVEAEHVDREQWGDNMFGKSLNFVRLTMDKEQEVKVDKTKKQKTKQKKKKSTRREDSEPFDASIFDVGGRLSIWW